MSPAHVVTSRSPGTARADVVINTCQPDDSCMKGASEHVTDADNGNVPNTHEKWLSVWQRPFSIG
jgi:hypothetical protein